MLTNEMKPIKFWCQKVLPLVYDDSLSYYEVLAKTVDYLNKVIEDDKNVIELVNKLETWVNENREYIDNYFENLNVQNEINVKLDEMASNGTLGDIIEPLLEQFEHDAMSSIGQQVSAWLDHNITPTNPPVDATLTVSGAAADAKVTGDKITDLKNAIDEIETEVYEQIQLTNLTTETNRYITVQEQINKIGAWDVSSIAYIPISDDLRGKKYVVKSDTLLTYLAIAVYDVFPSYGVIGTDGAGAYTPNNPSVKEMSVEAAETSRFLVISYLTEDEPHISLYVYNSEKEIIVNDYNAKITALQNTDAEIKEELEGIATAEINMLEDATLYEGYAYRHYETEKVATSVCNCFSPIRVKAGVTYYFRRAWGNFSCIKYDNGSFISLNAETGVTSGSVTPFKNGYAYITVENIRDASSALFTTSEAMYNKARYASRYLPNMLEVPKTFTCRKDGTGDFSKLSDAIIEATKYMDSIVYVGAGTWDLIDELGSEYIESVGINNRGLYLKNRIHLIFASNSKVTCNYSGTTSAVRTWLSAFNAGAYGFTLENCRLEASNCRYAMHDERDSDSDTYTNTYKNCSMYMDNSTNTDTTAHQCIGGGLGVNGHIVIENCDFESVNTRAVPTVYTPVSYHNSAGTGKNRIDASGVYMKKGTFRLNWYGSSTEKTKCYVHDCSLTHAIINNAETSGSTNENMEVIAWNNDIRSA